MEYQKTFEARWADVDINGHMRHSAYNDYAAHVRVKMFEDFGYSLTKLMQLGIGPVLFREEIHFKNELALDETFTVNCELEAARPSVKIWKMKHTVCKTDGTIAAIINVDGGWLDLKLRKVVNPPQEIVQLMHKIPKSPHFQMLEGH